MEILPTDFDTLWYQWFVRLSSYAREFQYLGEEDREEAVADILEKVWVARFSYKPEYSLTTWVYRIARNYLLNRQRSLRRRQARQEPAPEIACWPVDQKSCFRPEDQYSREETLAELQRALNTLGPEDRELLWLVYREGLSQAEAGRVCDLSESNVKTRLFRLRASLREKLEKYHEYD